MASELGVTRKELQNGKVRLPAYRAFYLDYLLKESTGVTYYRDQMLKAMVRSVKSVEDSDFTAPERLRGVLREYQRIGYVWLRTLDSYGFGVSWPMTWDWEKPYRLLPFWRTPMDQANSLRP